MDYKRLKQTHKEMKAGGQPVPSLQGRTRSRIERVECWGVVLRAEAARTNPTRTFRWKEIEQNSPHGNIKRALRRLMGEK